MKQNPYSTALFSIGIIGMILAVVSFAAGGSGGGGSLGALAFAGALFPVAGFALVGWLLLEGSQWKRPAAKPSLTESRKP